MARIWLRLELFELGLLQLPSKYAASLTLANVKQALNALHQSFQMQTSAMVDTEMTDATESMYAEEDAQLVVGYPSWKAAIEGIFQWREQDYKALWLLLVRFHMQSCTDAGALDAVVADEDYCFGVVEVPMYKVAMFLFIQTARPHSWRLKHALESFNAVWHRENTSPSEGSPGSGSPQIKPTSSPPPPSSPHMMGMQDRSTSDAYFLSFVRDKLEELVRLLFPSADLSEESETVLASEQFDLLGFLLATGDAQAATQLSSAYTKWQVASDSSQAFESSGKLFRFLKRSLCLNEVLYPPVGFSLGGSSSSVPNLSAVGDLSLSDSNSEAEMTHDQWKRPIVVSNVSKTTIIKRPEEFTDELGLSDLVIFSCHDAYIYILGPVRHVMITACHNSRLIIGPSTGVFCMDRCENVQVTAISRLVRVSNCLDSRLNAYTLVPIVMTGENVGVELGPFNTKYAGLSQQLAGCKFAFHSTSEGSWSSFLNLESNDETTENERDPITLQAPKSFREVCVPIKTAMGMQIERSFPLPLEYLASLKTQQETVEKLRRLVCSEDFDLATRRSIELVVQHRFKEWLTVTGNGRQILDLVQIERARGSSTNGNNSMSE